jgi:hypothetical protein
VLKGYGCLAAAAGITALVLKAGGHPILPGTGVYLPAGSLAHYWSSRGPTSLAGDVAAVIIGIELVASHRTLLTSGVMVAMALIPSAAIMGVAIAAWNGHMLVRALERWSFDAVAVLLLSSAVFAWKRRTFGRRRMWL